MNIVILFTFVTGMVFTAVFGTVVGVDLADFGVTAVVFAGFFLR